MPLSHAQIWKAIDALARGTDLTPADYGTVLRGLRFVPLAESLPLLQGSAPGIAPALQAVSRALIDIGAVQAAPDPARLIDPAPLQRVLAAQPAEARP